MYKKIVFLLEDFFGISKKQARSSIYLFVVSIVALIVPSIYQRWVVPHFSSELSETDRRRLDSLTDKIAGQMKRDGVAFPVSEQMDQDRTPEAGERRVRLFRFDPNSASTDELQELGIPAFLVRRIENYRKKGGQFRSREDLQRIYDFPSELYQRLLPFIYIQGSTVESNSLVREAKPFRTLPESREEYGTRKSPSIATFDINTCDTTQLIRLKGIGVVLASRIIRFRDALGGFYSEMQYSEIYGLDSLVVNELKKFAKVNSPHRKLNINQVGVEELLKHPYLRRERQFVQTLIQFRNQHGNYSGFDDLRKLKLNQDDLISKVAPYFAY